MGVIDSSIEIEASPDVVFRICSDLENELRWNPKAEKAVKVTDGPVGEGTRYRAKWKRSPEMDVDCVAFDAVARTWTNHNKGPLEVTSAFTVAPTDAGSRLTCRFQVEGHGIGKLMAGVLTKQMRRDIPDNLDRIKNLIESGAFPA